MCTGCDAGCWHHRCSGCRPGAVHPADQGRPHSIKWRADVMPAGSHMCQCCAGEGLMRGMWPAWCMGAWVQLLLHVPVTCVHMTQVQAWYGIVYAYECIWLVAHSRYQVQENNAGCTFSDQFTNCYLNRTLIADFAADCMYGIKRIVMKSTSSLPLTASAAQIFVRAPWLHFAISAGGALLFSCYLVFDLQVCTYCITSGAAGQVRHMA